uniref:STX17-like N-terminal domain-containing protein n=1 Tax=Capra hircus TaxID=9925 RepID=A0A8C2NVE1_CAPHI
MSEDEEKVKLRRLEPAIQKFTKIVIPTDLERLRKHQINIEKVFGQLIPTTKSVS